MLKNIPKNITPDLLKILMEMGHGDEIVLAGANFASASNSKRLVVYPDCTISMLLSDILELFPIDTYSDAGVFFIQYSNDTEEPANWREYRDKLHKFQEDACVKKLPYKDFYNKAKNAYAIVATTDSTLFSTIILRKGIVC